MSFNPKEINIKYPKLCAYTIAAIIALTVYIFKRTDIFHIWVATSAILQVLLLINKSILQNKTSSIEEYAEIISLGLVSTIYHTLLAGH